MIAAPAQPQGLLISQFSLRHGIAEYPLRAALRRGLVTLPKVGRVSVWPSDPAAAAAILAKLREHGLIPGTPTPTPTPQPAQPLVARPAANA